MQFVKVDGIGRNDRPSDAAPAGQRFVVGDNPEEDAEGNPWALPNHLAYNDRDGLGWTFGALDPNAVYLNMRDGRLWTLGDDGRLMEIGR